MTDPTADDVSGPFAGPASSASSSRLRSTPAVLDALADVARWTGSSQNTQPWRFIVITRAVDAARHPRRPACRRPAASRPRRRRSRSSLPSDPAAAVRDAYDEGRVAERILVAATMLDIGAGISWIRRMSGRRSAALLGLPADRMVRTIVQLGHPTAAARQPKSAPGEARLPRDEVVFHERWPEG